ncbi:MAG: methyltransferase domain protein [Devosia sp.]|uniref:FkbM family methyltransferase n=1 Tax=Devosia sp. TaxID=1871048 RepID=UPI002603778E|nr:FkbM family methyltransferase [Devosia sp.]MDB5540994.1 methyltransferase domain protein [Devosia sp.]
MNSWFRRSRARTEEPIRTIRLNGLAPFPMETHGKRDLFVSTHIEDWGNWELSGTAMVLQLLGSAADFVDVGANIGWYSLIAGHALAGRGRVHSFEPEPANLAKLRANVTRNGLRNVAVNGWALADYEGTAQLHLSADNLGDHRLAADGGGRPSVPVEVRTLDGYGGISPERPVVIKIDAQGSEVQVLAGARRLLREHPHEIVLMCEVSPCLLLAGGGSAEALIGELSGAGYAAALIDRQRPRIKPIGWEQLRRREAEGLAIDPAHEDDIIAYRRLDGLMRPIFGLGG